MNCGATRLHHLTEKGSFYQLTLKRTNI
uniref:Uncharacterized protein n=1 Tax=Anguilla anguilla TaxID=7936 RepID=A0A0E9VN19_ANGAN